MARRNESKNDQLRAHQKLKEENSIDRSWIGLAKDLCTSARLLPPQKISLVYFGNCIPWPGECLVPITKILA